MKKLLTILSIVALTSTATSVAGCDKPSDSDSSALSSNGASPKNINELIDNVDLGAVLTTTNQTPPNEDDIIEAIKKANPKIGQTSIYFDSEPTLSEVKVKINGYDEVITFKYSLKVDPNSIANILPYDLGDVAVNDITNPLESEIKTAIEIRYPKLDDHLTVIMNDDFKSVTVLSNNYYYVGKMNITFNPKLSVFKMISNPDLGDIATIDKYNPTASEVLAAIKERYSEFDIDSYVATIDETHKLAIISSYMAGDSMAVMFTPKTALKAVLTDTDLGVLAVYQSGLKDIAQADPDYIGNAIFDAIGYQNSALSGEPIDIFLSDDLKSATIVDSIINAIYVGQVTVTFTLKVGVGNVIGMDMFLDLGDILVNDVNNPTDQEIIIAIKDRFPDLSNENNIEVTIKDDNHADVTFNDVYLGDEHVSFNPKQKS